MGILLLYFYEVSITERLASQMASPRGLVATHLYMPASLCLQLLITKVHTPQTFEMEYLLFLLMGSPFLNQAAAGSGLPAKAAENLACRRSATMTGFIANVISQGRLKSIFVRLMPGISNWLIFLMTERRPEIAPSPLPNSFSPITLKK